jgi:hypothetical protein
LRFFADGDGGVDGFLYKFGSAGVYSVSVYSVKVMGQIVVKRQWNRGKTQYYEDDNQIAGGGHSWWWTIYQWLRQKTTRVVVVARQVGSFRAVEAIPRGAGNPGACIGETRWK